ncbi:MAG TPA: GxxExxY protein [Terriglobia bacterium]|nr:GxxExxY protein [Terriglobia bacterium]
MEDQVTARNELKHGDITDLVLKAFFRVYNELDYGFLEKIYENALIIAARELGLAVEQQVRVHIYFDGKVVGDHVIDLLFNNAVIVEVKAAKSLLEEHEAQLLNYLKATPFEVGLLLNFGPKPQFKRKVYDNGVKGNLSWYKPV